MLHHVQDLRIEWEDNLIHDEFLMLSLLPIISGHCRSKNYNLEIKIFLQINRNGQLSVSFLK